MKLHFIDENSITKPYLGLKITVESQKLAACPISALLCLLVAELLSLVLKKDKEIKGIKCLIGKEI